MSLKLLRFSLSAISLPLSLIFKMSINSCTFPTAWKMGQIIPIHKKGNRSDLANYRPITLLPLLSKTMEYLVHQQLKNYLDGNKLLHAAQHSCCTALLDISTTLSTAKNKGQYTVMVALDYSKAFDTINHSILLRKMKIINFDANALSWFDSYLTGRQQFVNYCETESGTVPTPHGVPQGSIMGPTLYLIYQNDLFTHLSAGCATGYADNVTISASEGTASEAVAALQHLIDIVSEWSSANCLHLNPVKCKTMLIATRKKAASQTNQCSSLVIKGASVA